MLNGSEETLDEEMGARYATRASEWKKIDYTLSSSISRIVRAGLSLTTVAHVDERLGRWGDSLVSWYLCESFTLLSQKAIRSSFKAYPNPGLNRFVN